MMIKLRNNFIAGLLVVLPIVVTILILRFVIITINSYLLEPITSFLRIYVKPALPTQLANVTLLAVLAKLFIFVGLIGLVVLVGLMTRIILFRKIISSGENILARLPLVNKIYVTIRQISHAFLGREKSVFQKVALIEYPRKGIYSIGFVTRKSLGEVQAKTKETLVNIFVPTTPNPTSGVLLMVPEEDIIYMDMTVEQGLKLVISGGAVAPHYKGPEIIHDGHREGRGDCPQKS